MSKPVERGFTIRSKQSFHRVNHTTLSKGGSHLRACPPSAQDKAIHSFGHGEYERAYRSRRRGCPVSRRFRREGVAFLSPWLRRQFSRALDQAHHVSALIFMFISFVLTQLIQHRRRVDLWMLPVLGALYAVCVIDRSNLGLARVAGMDRDLVRCVANICVWQLCFG